MKVSIRLLLKSLCGLFILLHTAHAQRITDTIFYNQAWRICEKPIANYYRIGTLVIDSVWYYTGKFRDYDVNGLLRTEGEYNNKGEKDGLFRFYNRDGKLMMSGKFWQDLMIGNWQWYYSNDSTQAIINFDGPVNDFKFVQYKLPDGKILLDKGTGDFQWETHPYAMWIPGFRVYGSFTAGKRSGAWRFYTVRNDKEDFRFSEKYDKDGHFKRTTTSADYRGDNPKDRYKDFSFIPDQMKITENMLYDQFFKEKWDSTDRMKLLNYLLNRKSSEIIVKNKNVENALSQIIHSLEMNRHRLEYQQKEIDASIEFKIGEKGKPEELTVTGTGLTEKEKEFIIFLVSKFSEIEMPGMESVAIESYYKINLYSINMKEFVPAFLRDQVNNDIFFSMLPKDKLLVLFRSVKKKIKKYIREEFQFYW